jgi:hypothetical protein
MKGLLTKVPMLLVLSIALSVMAQKQPVNFKPAFDLSKEQRRKLDSANKIKSSAVRSLRDQENASIDLLRQKIDAKAPDAEITPVFATIRSDMKSQQEAESSYWETLAGFLTPMQQAKLFLKNHPPKNVSPPPAQAPKPATAPQPPQLFGNPPQDWKMYFGLAKEQQAKFDAANKAKSTTLKPLRENQDGAIEALRQKVDANAPDPDIAATFNSVKADILAIQGTENAYWDTLSGFLTPTQQAKLFLKGKPKK